MRKKRILIFVVAYNAKLQITNLFNRIPKEIIDESDEILLADDASQDDTSKIALDYKIKNNIHKLKIVKHAKNKGYGGNQKWGYNYAIQNNFDIVVLLHGDEQYPPEHIGLVIKPLKEDKADFVFGSRMTGNPRKGGMPLYKFIGNKFLSKIENIVLHTNLSEFHSGFRAYNVHALEEIPFNICSDDFHFDSEIIIQLVLAKKKIDEFTIPTRYSIEKCNVNPVFYGLNILRVLSQYWLHKTGFAYYKKFEI